MPICRVARVDEVMPEAREGAIANRAFLRRAVRYLVREAGIRRFLDLGSGLPTAGNVHEVAQFDGHWHVGGVARKH